MDNTHTISNFVPQKASGWQALVHNKLAMFSLGFILLLVLLAVFAPLIARDPRAIEMRRTVGEVELNPPFPPGILNLLGTDQLGRDIFSRVLFGLRTSLIVGVIVRGVTMTVGVLIGLVSGYFGGFIDSGIMRVTDIMLAFPVLLLAMTVTAVLGPGLFTVCFALVLVAWPDVTRLIRGQVLYLKEQTFVEAARSCGASNSRILFSHILPNCLGVIIVAFSMGIPGAIMYEAGLSFFGFGIQPPMPSLGSLIADGRGYIINAPWYPGFPGLVLTLLVLSFNVLGDALIDSFDPRAR
jgi:peptide/nickel transport system permease protein